jgi:hypothetical protein
MFGHVLSALPAEMVSQVLDVVEALPAAGQYEFFKNELLIIHQLSDYEKFDALVKMEPMGGRKPSQLLHAMLEFCTLGMERHLSFHYFFMQRLPQTLRTQLGEVQPGDPRQGRPPVVCPLYQGGWDCRRRRRPGGPSAGQHSRRERSWSWQQGTRRADPRPRGGQRRSQGAGGNRRQWHRRRADPV